MRRRGASLATVLLLLAVLSVLVFTVAQSSILHLFFSTEVDSRQHARNLAESAIARALAEVLQNETYGATHQPGQAITVTGPVAGSTGYLSFNQGEASGQGSPYSTNNLAGAGSVPGDHCAVPRGVLHLMGTGRVGQVVQTVEVMYYRPPYPKGLASSGPIAAEALSLMGLPAGVPYPGQPADRLPGSLFSNNRGTPAIDLKAGSDITGDVASPGTISLQPGVRVAGEVRPGSGPQPIPDFDLAAMVGRAKTVAGTKYIEGVVGPQTVDWYTGSTTGVTIGGDLTLDNGVLWVDGSLTVQGAIKGKGVVLARDRITLIGGASFRADNAVALACGQELDLRGGGQADHFFQGVLYSEKSIQASDLTVLGCAVANSPDPAAGGIDLKNVTVVQTPDGAGNAVGVPALVQMVQDRGPRPNTNRGGGGISITPKFDPYTGKLMDSHDVHIYMPADNYDKTWRNLTYHQVKALAKRLYDKHGAVPHNQSTYDTIHKLVDDIWANPQGYVIWLAPNNLLPPAEKSHMLLWRLR